MDRASRTRRLLHASWCRPCARLRAKGGFTLIEVLCALVISLVVGLGVIGSIIFTRQSLELEKQRTAALNYARQAMEAAQSRASIDAGVKTLVEFNTPGTRIEALVSVAFYPVGNNGVVEWASPLPTAPNGSLALCRVDVNWNSCGAWSRPQCVRLQSIVRAGTL